MRDLPPAALRDYLDSAEEAPLLLDVREPWEFAICHLEGSELLPMAQIPAAAAGGKLPKDRDIVVICHHGIRSRQVAMFLEYQGFDRVINLYGGVDAWARDVDRTMAVY
jgi:rhodanese-related sulfurtransferase